MTRLAAITGGTGFLGRHAAAALAARGWRLRMLVRRAPDLPELAGEEIELVPGHLSEPFALDRFAEGADLILHVAGAVKAPSRDAFMAANAEGTAALARAWREQAPGARFILVSSMAARAPQLSDYAASKRAGEERLRAAAEDGDFRILRPGAIYGPHDEESLKVLKLASGRLQVMLNAPTSRVSMIAAQDAGEAIAALAAHQGGGAIHELTDARREGYSWVELIETAALALGREPRPVRLPALALRALGAAGGAFAATTGRASMLTPGKAREILWPDWSADASLPPIPPEIWAPKIRLAQGLAEMADWARRSSRL